MLLFRLKLDRFIISEQRNKRGVLGSSGEWYSTRFIWNDRTNAGSDAGGTQTIAVQDGEDYITNGEKCFITNASFTDAIIVTAVNGKDEKGKNIISAIIVPTDTEGVTIQSNCDKMGVLGYCRDYIA